MPRRRSPRVSAVVLFALSGSIGCEVSVFGSEPIQLAGGPTPAPGGESGACGEPEEIRVARERLASGDPSSGEESPCAYHCILVAGAVAESTRATCPLLTVDDAGVVHLDMSRSDGLLLRAALCSGNTLQLADSVGARSDGGDDTSTSHDASLVLHRGTLELFPAHDGGLAASRVEGYVPAHADTQCIVRTIELTDSVAYLPELERGLCGTSMLRIDPPTDTQGSPDSLWHLALGRTLDDARNGSPPPSLDLCFL